MCKAMNVSPQTIYWDLFRELVVEIGTKERGVQAHGVWIVRKRNRRDEDKW